jgi:hypothetical protein
MRTWHPVVLILTFLVLIACIGDEIVEEIGDMLNVMPEYNGYYYKLVNDVDERSVERYWKKMRAMYDMYLNDDMNIYYTIVPNKSIYTDDESAREYYNNIVEILNSSVDIAEYIELSDVLALENYYKTDDHWKQETLEKVVKRLGDKMGFSVDFTKFTENEVADFIGMYNTQVEELTPETLVYLNGEYTDKAKVDYFQNPEITDIYDVEKLTSDVMYDVYLSGVSPVITITNEFAENERELIIFRDSFASSLTPLLLEAYSKITLIDSRFIMMDLVGDYVDFQDQDVLFIHCDLIINNSLLLK